MEQIIRNSFNFNPSDLLMGDNQNNVLFGSLDNDIISGGR